MNVWKLLPLRTPIMGGSEWKEFSRLVEAVMRVEELSRRRFKGRRRKTIKYG